MRAAALDRFCKDLRPILPGTRTCDGFKAGDPDTELTGIAVTWMATTAVIVEAVSRGLNCLITHEPIYYNHWDNLTGLEHDSQAQRKLTLINRHKLVIYRVHDAWDTFPGYGVLDSWARHLRWSTELAFDGRHKVYCLPPITLGGLALEIKRRMALTGLRVHGDLARIVAKPALGVGAWGQLDDVREVLQLGAECLVTGESCEWQAIRYAQDAGLAVVNVGHSNSENPGLVSLAAYLQEHLTALPIVFLDSGDPCHYL